MSVPDDLNGYLVLTLAVGPAFVAAIAAAYVLIKRHRDGKNGRA